MMMLYEIENVIPHSNNITLLERSLAEIRRFHKTKDDMYDIEPTVVIYKIVPAKIEEDQVKKIKNNLDRLRIKTTITPKRKCKALKRLLLN